MKTTMISIAVAAALCLAVVDRGSAAPAAGSKAQIAHGEYLVKAIGQCADCHTPMNDHGQFFMTGLAPNGQPARPPMPEYKMNRADAEAVVAYLRSLK